jgi:hypothetical protein
MMFTLAIFYGLSLLLVVCPEHDAAQKYSKSFNE